MSQEFFCSVVNFCQLADDRLAGVRALIGSLYGYINLTASGPQASKRVFEIIVARESERGNVVLRGRLSMREKYFLYPWVEILFSQSMI